MKQVAVDHLVADGLVFKILELCYPEAAGGLFLQHLNLLVDVDLAETAGQTQGGLEHLPHGGITQDVEPFGVFGAVEARQRRCPTLETESGADGRVHLVHRILEHLPLIVVDDLVREPVGPDGCRRLGVEAESLGHRDQTPVPKDVCQGSGIACALFENALQKGPAVGAILYTECGERDLQKIVVLHQVVHTSHRSDGFPEIGFGRLESVQHCGFKRRGGKGIGRVFRLFQQVGEISSNALIVRGQNVACEPVFLERKTGGFLEAERAGEGDVAAILQLVGQGAVVFRALVQDTLDEVRAVDLVTQSKGGQRDA